MTAVIDPNTSDSQLIMLLVESRAKVRELTEQRDAEKARADNADGKLRHVYRAFQDLANDNRLALTAVDEMIQADVDSIVADRIDAKTKLTAALAREKVLVDAINDQIDCSDATYETIDNLNPDKPMGHDTYDLLLAMVCVPGLKDALTQRPGRGAINYEGTQEIVGVVMKKLRKSLDDTAKAPGRKEEEAVIPLCARCYHEATAHAVDDEELRECTESDCVCGEYLDAAEGGG